MPPLHNSFILFSLLISAGQSALTNPDLTLGPQKTSFILVNFNDQPGNQPWSTETMQGTFNTVDNFYIESSYQKTSLQAAALEEVHGTVQSNLQKRVQGWFTLPINSSSNCNTVINIISEVREGKIQLAGLDLTNTDRAVFFFPRVSDCSFRGLGDLGGQSNLAWINGNIDAQVVSHEYGHLLGLNHARFLQCGFGNNPLDPKCVTVEYGDPSDVMGAAALTHSNAYQKEVLSWLNYGDAPKIQIVNQPGNFLIEPLETLTKNTKALKILKGKLSDNSSDYYYLEYRQLIGFDSSLPKLNNDDDNRISALTRGILIHIGNDKNSNSSLLLDMTPQTSDAKDAALGAGRIFSDSSAAQGGIQIEVISLDSAGANVKISFGTTFTGVSGGDRSLPRSALLITGIALVFSSL